MRRKRSNPTPCWNYECPHNLFWEELKLNGDRIRVTQKAVEIGNCCCLINTPWTVEEIEAAWGIPGAEIRRCEETAWKKVYKKNGGVGYKQINVFMIGSGLPKQGDFWRTRGLNSHGPFFRFKECSSEQNWK